MLSVKPWRAEAIIRLILSLIVCFCAGSLAVAIMQHGKVARALSVGQMIVAALVSRRGFGAGHTVFARTRDYLEEAFGLPRQWARAVLYGFICASLFLPVGWGLQCFRRERCCISRSFT